MFHRNNMVSIKNVTTAVLFSVLSASAFAQNNISKKKAAAIAKEWLERAIENYRKTAAAEWGQKQIDEGTYHMKFEYKIFGEKPAGGRSLYISMHGGGNAAPAVNDQQWKNQIKLYAPKEGVYVAPRAPTDSWMLWHEPQIDKMFATLIKDAIVMEGVDPNKVYILGYSAGGDGVFQLAPRMADSWAAASMMAGHPGDAQILNLRNLPFAIYMGGLDSAYSRNKLAVKWQQKLDSLQKTDPEAYVHDVHIYPDRPHWMLRRDTIALPWLASFKRNPLPSKIIWVQDDVLHNRFYWLGVPPGQSKTANQVVATLSKNNISITRNDNATLLIYLNDKMLDLDRPVIINYLGKMIFKGKMPRNADLIKQTAADKLDAGLIFSACIQIKDGAVVK